MKSRIASRSSFFAPFLLISVLLLILFSFMNCTALRETISSQNDAQVAFTMPDPQITSYRFADITPLRIMLRERVDKFRSGIGFLKKQADLYKGTERVPHDRRIAITERKLNLVEAQVENLELIYPEEWGQMRGELDDEFKKLHLLYKEAYDPLL